MPPTAFRIASTTLVFEYFPLIFKRYPQLRPSEFASMIVDVIDIAEVWPGHPVGFALLTSQGKQFAGYYDRQRRLTVAQRDLGSKNWIYQTLPQTTGWDSHNYITLAVDQEGYLHLTAEMHVSPLVYFRTLKPGEITSFQRIGQMVGSEEQYCTYPVFLANLDGSLIFTYRDGGSGNGNQIYNRYDPQMKTWSRLIDAPLFDGEGQRSAYATTPALGPDRRFHTTWVWRDTPDASSNHDVSYARSSDLVNWETSTGKPIDLPIMLQSSEIIDPVPVRGGVINNNVHIGFDATHRPVITYHKYDQHGFTQVYNARAEDACWVIRQISDWDYRWDFGGLGSINFEITLSGVHQIDDGRWVQSYNHRQYGHGGWVLNPATLQAVAPYQPNPLIPHELVKTESKFAGMEVRLAQDLGVDKKSPLKHILRWEALGENRDRPRTGQLPESSMLKVIELS